MKTLGYYDGQIGELEDIKVPMLDRACYFGDGIYDATYSRNKKIFALDEHIDRFYRGLEKVDIRLDMTKDQLKDLLLSLVKKVDEDELFVYWQATRGEGLREHCYENMTAKLWVMLKPQSIVDMSQKIKLVTHEDIRYTLCDIKTLNLLPNVLFSQYAKNKNAHECILHRGDRVTECAHSNIHILKDNVLITPPADCFILKGVAREHLIRACKALGICVEIRPFSLDEMMDSDEVILTSSGSLCLQAESIDGKEVGGKSNDTIKLLQEYLLGEFRSNTEYEG